jgi:ssDNA-binding Zn-finger/Zn-ribbon topoisomerase 1
MKKRRLMDVIECPHCGSNKYLQIRRYGHLMIRLIPTAKLYECQECYEHFMTLFGKIRTIQRFR